MSFLSTRLVTGLRGPLAGTSRRWLSNPTGNKAPAPSRLQKYARRTAYFALGVGGVYVVDRTFNASSVSRNFRTLWTCALISLDYKLNFTAEHPERIPDIHQRVADRMYSLFTENGGLYIKIGQAIGANAALLPAPMREKFSRLFDDAPQIPYADVLAVFKSELGRPPSGPGGVFEIFEEQAVASASIAQVHKAKLREEDGGEWVAVKIQKPDVGKQVEWDLGAYRICMWMFENWVFDLPVYFVVDFVSDHLRAELDFIEEAHNASTMATLIAAEPRLADRVHIPKVYPGFSTKKVMTAEWIDGVRLSDRPAIRELMGEGDGEDPVRRDDKFAGVQLKGGVKAVMQTMVELFSAQMFSFGWVHCDPHPGNIIIRPHPLRPREPQLVLLDHGLYVTLSPEFQRQYATLWKGLISTDFGAVERVTREWGIGTPDLFASATLMRPVKLGNGSRSSKAGGEQVEELNQYEQSVRMKAKLRSFLTDTDKMPKELIFLGRNMRMVQGNNQALGSPVNRIKMTGFWASRSLAATPNLGAAERLREYWYYFLFRGVMFSLDVAFWESKMRAWVRRRILGQKGGEGFEDELERSLRGLAKSSMGVEIGPGAFEG
ncbi:hypothetical protein HWV62_22784 [Athelia sp. TMB]|nr:hypothetical protein HWV62_22784 [Athelia sp. TMB]